MQLSCCYHPLDAQASLGPYQPPGCRAGGFELRRCGADAKTKIPVSGHAEVWVAYSPDPSMILSQCLLLVETSIGRQHFHLSASTPHEALPPVHSMFSMSPELSKQRIWVILGTLVLALVALIVAFRELHEELMLSICALMATQGPAEKPQAGEAPCARVGDASVQQVVAVRQPAGLNSPGAAPIPHRAPSDSPGHPGEAPEAADDSQVDEVKGGRRRRRHKCPPDTGSTVAPCDGGSARDAPSSPRLQIDSIKHTGSTSSCGTGASTPVPMPSTPCPAVSDISSAQPPDTRGQILTGNESEASPTLCVSSPSEVPDAGAETCVEDSDEPLSPACRLRSGHLAWSPGSSKSGPSSRQIEETEPVQHVAPMPEAVTSLPGPSPPLAVRSSAQQSSQTGGGVEAPGSKRMAHAKLLTPLQTSEQPNLGVIMPASQHKQKLAHPHPSAPLLDTVPSPGMGHPEASPRDPGATPRSARRRRRPRRGGGSSSQPPTPGTGSLSAATTPAGADTGTGLLPADAPHSQRLPVGNTWSTLPPARPPSSRSNVHAHSPGIGYGQAMSNPAGSLDQLGAAVGVPDSLYSIWGSSSGRHASLLREPVAPPARNYCGNDSLGGSLFTSFPAGTNGDLLESRGWAPWGTMALDGQPAAMPLHAVLGEDLFVGSGLFPQSGGGLGSGGGGAFSGFSLFSPFLGGREMRGGAGDASYGDSGCATPFNTIWGQPSTGSSEFLWRQGSDDSNLRDPATSDENGAQGNPIW